MKKKNIVKSNILFNDIINKGKRISNKYYIICSVKIDTEEKKYGIAVGKKIGHAVVRNKLKRQIKNIIDNNETFFANYHNYIIILKRDILSLSFREKEKQLVDLIKKGDKMNCEK